MTSSTRAVPTSVVSIKPSKLVIKEDSLALVNDGASTSKVIDNKREKTHHPIKVVSSLSEAKKRTSVGNAGTRESSSVGTTGSSDELQSEPWQDQYEIFMQIFPDADPNFLKTMASSLLGKEDELRIFVADALENRSYPLKSSLGGSTIKELASTTSKITGAVNEGAPSSSSVEKENRFQQLKVVSSLSEVKRRMSVESSASEIGSGHSVEMEVPREPWQDQLDTFIQILPDADPSYLEEKAKALLGKEDELRTFIADALEKKEYPSRKDWQWRQEQLALQKKYTDEFSIQNFLEIIPDPFTYFSDPKRHCNRSLGEMFLRHK